MLSGIVSIRARVRARTRIRTPYLAATATAVVVALVPQVCHESRAFGVIAQEGLPRAVGYQYKSESLRGKREGERERETRREAQEPSQSDSR